MTNPFETILTKLESLERQMHAMQQQQQRTAQPERKVMTSTDVLRMLNISQKSLQNYVNRGLLPMHRIGRRVFFFEEEVLNAISPRPKKKAA